MRRVVALIAAALLALTIAGPVAAEPMSQSPDHQYVITCTVDGVTETTYQNAHGVPGWDVEWAPGDTPWLLMGYTITYYADGASADRPLPPGLDGNGKLYGPCTIEKHGRPSTWLITDAWFLHK